jgi:hypothetical protein
VKFARVLYGITAIYGVLSLMPLYFMAGISDAMRPRPLPILNFTTDASAWRCCDESCLISRSDSARNFEKFAYSVPVVILFLLGRVAPTILLSSLVDPILGVLFIVAYFRTPGRGQSLPDV